MVSINEINTGEFEADTLFDHFCSSQRALVIFSWGIRRIKATESISIPRKVMHVEGGTHFSLATSNPSRDVSRVVKE